MKRQHHTSHRQRRRDIHNPVFDESGQCAHNLYRSRRGMIFGVCRGLAHRFGLNTAGVRILAVIAMVLTGIWPAVIAYVVIALVVKPEPVLALRSEDDAEFYNSYTGSRTMALHRLKRTYENLDRRIQRMESTVTSRGYDWDSRLNGGR